MDMCGVVHETKSRFSYVYENDKLHVRLKTKKGEVKSVIVNAGDLFDNVEIRKGKYGINPKTRQSVEMTLEAETELYDVWFGEISGIPSLRVKYAFFITDVNEERYILNYDGLKPHKEEFKPIENVNEFFNFPCMNPEDVYVAPSWTKNTIWYQFTATCFSDDGEEAKDNRSGNLRGLIKKLDYIKEMGYTAIYMTPIFEANAWHLYDTINYHKVDPKLGTNEDLKELVQKAHKLGLKVILDGVFNHCGHQHPYWKDVMEKGEKSKYYECFCPLDKTKPLFEGTFKNEEDYLSRSARDYNFATFALTLHMPKLNFSSQIIRDYVLDIGEYWIREYDIDGWRLDVSNEVPHEFWREFRVRVKKLKPEAFLMGENWDDSYPWLMGDQFDAVMNYGILNAIRKYICPYSKEFYAKDYMYAINELTIKYPKNVTENLFNMVSSHDVDRILTAVDGDFNLVKLCYLLLLTYSGAPCIYYGDEVGIGGREQENRVPMIFDESRQNVDLKQFIKKLIEIRKSTTAFHDVNCEWLLVDNETNTVIFRKQNYYVLVHNKNKSEKITLPKELANTTVLDVINDTKIDLNSTIDMNEFGYAIYKK